MHKVRKCGDDVERCLQSFVVSSPIGNLVVQACDRGLHSVCQAPDINDKNFSPDCRVPVEFLESYSLSSPSGKLVVEAVNWLKTYFHDLKNLQDATVPCFCDTSEDGSFQEKVWLTLFKSVTPGQVISYSDLAKLAGSKGAQQAVGTAMAKNPYQLLVPCHRVVKSGNKVGKYSSGCRNTVKIWLLQHEGLIVSSDGTVG